MDINEISLTLRAIAQLPQRERTIMVERFGLRDGEPKTLEHLASLYDLSRERIRQIEREAMRRIAAKVNEW